MNEDLRPITTKTLPDAIRLLNETSRDTCLHYNVDFFSFLALRRLWNFSLGYSFIRYIDGLPAAIAINCADPQAREAYNFYWGTLAQFRSPRVSISLFNASCQKLYGDGYVMLYGDSLPDRPIQRYRFIQALPLHPLVDMKGSCCNLPEPDPNFIIRKIDANTISRIPSLSSEPLHWAQRPSFLANVEFFFDFIGAFAADDLRAYAVITAKSAEVNMFDLRSPDSCRPAAYELLRYIAQNYPSPIVVLHVLEGSFTERLLSDSGFTVLRRYSSLYRDLRATCAQASSQPPILRQSAPLAPARSSLTAED